MKQIPFIVYLWIFSSVVLAQEQVDPGSVPAQPTGTETQDTEFHDPFATESGPTKPQPKISDPLEPMNRAFFQFNDKLYFYVLKPVSKGYSKVAPRDFRACVKRFFINTRYPIRVVNNLLQGHFKGAGMETTRFVLNSTAGLAGFFDPCTEWNIKAYPADLDQTLGVYGFHTGIYFDWPIFGPSSVRGVAGRVGDSFLTPWAYIDGLPVRMGVPPYEIINATSFRIGEYESFKRGSLDPYVALRSAYFENRQAAVKNAKIYSAKPTKSSKGEPKKEQESVPTTRP